VRNVVMEVRGEKIDVVPWSPDLATFVANALQPAKVKEVRVDPATQTAIVIVPDYQLSLAIGKEGQNARLAARLTGCRIDIRAESQPEGGPRPAARPADAATSASGDAPPEATATVEPAEPEAPAVAEAGATTEASEEAAEA
jgi:N utilization substance protein A